MESLAAQALPEGALVLVDSAPIIYTLEARPRHARRFAPLFQAQEENRLELAVSTITLAEVLATHDRDFSRVRGLRILG